jgi:hypothetical protein
VGNNTPALEATLRVRFAMRALADRDTGDEQFAPLLRDLANSQLRSLSLYCPNQEEARALQLGKALPPSLVDVRFEDGHPALAEGLTKSALAQRGQLRTLRLRSCEVVGAQLQPLLAALPRSGGQLQTLDLGCARATAQPGRGVWRGGATQRQCLSVRL